MPYWRIECSQNNTARNGVPRAISDAMKSFPSGHAQLSAFAAVFMIVSGNCIKLVDKVKNYLILGLHSEKNPHFFFLPVEALVTNDIHIFHSAMFNNKNFR